jgi:inosine-uridine nucleoside N-ribohydrolase
MTLDDTRRLQRLEPPAAGRRLRVVIDTDAANEIDDQYALAWAIAVPERLAVEAIHAAPFSFAHRRAAYPQLGDDHPPFAPPDVGMRRSAAEIRRVLAACRADGHAHAAEVTVCEGTPGYLSASPDAPPRSAAVDDLIARAMAPAPDDAPLYVLVLGCPTNIACALRLEPRIAERIVVVWTSGYPSHAPHANRSFNLEQDLAATRTLLDSGVPLVYLPGFHVGAQLRLSWPEVERWVRPCGATGALLAELYALNPLWPMHGISDLHVHSWVLWDVICVAWLIDPGWVPSTVVPTPSLDAGLCWVRGNHRHPMREAHGVQRDAIFRDLLGRLARRGGAPGAGGGPAP